MNSLIKFSRDLNWALDPYNDPIEWAWNCGVSLPKEQDLVFQSHEEGDDGVLEFSLPGFDKEDIDITIEGNVLTVIAEKKTEERYKSASKFAKSRVTRSIAVDENFDCTDGSTFYKNGVLKVVFSKKEEKKSKKMVLEISD
jgi:HSP20 family protein